MSKNKIVDLIVDAASDKILFKLISKDKIYTNEYENCRKNFDKFSVLLMNFLTKKQYSFKKIRNVFINQGPGKYTSIRTSMAIIKALQLVYGFNYYGFNNKDKVNGDYKKILQLFRQKKLIKNLIKPLYLRVSKIDKKISIATVYRTVKLFEESGILAKHEFKGSKARYEELNEGHHDHLIDVKTGEIIEFVDEEIEKLQKRVAEKYGYKLVDHKLELYGVKKKSQ